MEPIDPALVNVISLFIGMFSPVAVDAFKRDTWKPSQTLLCGFGVSIALFCFLRWVTGTFYVPITYEFLSGLVGTFGGQQTGYNFLFKNRNPEPTTAIETNVIPASGVVVTTTETKEGV